MLCTFIAIEKTVNSIEKPAKTTKSVRCTFNLARSNVNIAMSNEVSIENNEIPQLVQPSHSDDQNSETTINNMCSNADSDQSALEGTDNDDNNAESTLKLTDNESETMSVCIDEKEESMLVDQVNKLDIVLKKPEEPKVTVREYGVVVQHKLNDSLQFIQSYNSDSEDSSSSSSESQDEVKDALCISDTSDEDNEESDDSGDELFCDGPSNKKPVKKEEKSLHELMADFGINQAPKKIPDISLLSLSNNEEFLHMGNIACVLSQYVTIEGLPAMPAYDLDTLLFVDEGQKCLGYIFDVMGPVAAPMYVVTLDSLESVANLQLKKGTKVYCAPKSKYTKYVFVHELMKVRGSDASWVGDTEIPPEFEEFSDDEEERKKKSLKNKSTKRKRGSLERHQQFEANMNKINQLNSRLHKLKDARKYFDVRVKNQRPKEAGCSSLVGTVPNLPAELGLGGPGEANPSPFVPNWRAHPNYQNAFNLTKNCNPPNQPQEQSSFFDEFSFFTPPTQGYYASAFFPTNSTVVNSQNGINYRPNDGSGPSSGC